MICEIRYDILSRKHELCLFKELENGEAECIVFEMRKEKVAEHAPLAVTSFPRDEGRAIFQALATALQKEGFLPESATSAELKATKFHLEDMRKIAFSEVNDLLSVR